LNIFADKADVSDWAAAAVAYFADAEIIKGYSNTPKTGETSFSPKKNITRAEVCSIMLLALDYTVK
jgi:hypothetical protein